MDHHFLITQLRLTDHPCMFYLLVFLYDLSRRQIKRRGECEWKMTTRLVYLIETISGVIAQCGLDGMTSP